MGGEIVYLLKSNLPLYNEAKLLTIISLNLPNQPNNKPNLANSNPLMNLYCSNHQNINNSNE